jgi:hypothetical protein
MDKTDEVFDILKEMDEKFGVDYREFIGNL